MLEFSFRVMGSGDGGSVRAAERDDLGCCAQSGEAQISKVDAQTRKSTRTASRRERVSGECCTSES